MLQRRSTAIQKQRLGTIRVRSGTSPSDGIALYTTDSRNGVEEQSGDSDDTEYYGSLDAEANLVREMWQTQLQECPAAETVTALYDFAPLAEGDLEFKKGDVIEVVKRTQNPNEWWTGKFNGNEGMFPGRMRSLLLNALGNVWREFADILVAGNYVKLN
jgi:SH3 domain